MLCNTVLNYTAFCSTTPLMTLPRTDVITEFVVGSQLGKRDWPQQWSETNLMKQLNNI